MAQKAVKHVRNTDIAKYRDQRLRVISCDYHADPTPTAGQTAYGMPVHVFNRAEIESVLTTARDIGFEPTSPAVLDCAERPVHWARVGIDFTFLVLALRKINTTARLSP